MTTSIIRTTLWSLYYRRQHTIQRMKEGGRNMRKECEALQALKIQMEASKQWGTRQHIAMVIGMKNHIVTLVQVTFTRDKTFRNKILDLLLDCQAIQQQPTLF